MIGLSSGGALIWRFVNSLFYFFALSEKLTEKREKYRYKYEN